MRTTLGLFLMLVSVGVWAGFEEPRQEVAASQKADMHIFDITGKTVWHKWGNCSRFGKDIYKEQPASYFDVDGLTKYRSESGVTKIKIEQVINRFDTDFLYTVSLPNGETGYMIRAIDSPIAPASASSYSACIYSDDPIAYAEEQTRQQNASLLAEEQRLAKQAKKPGVRIGMTKKQVINKTSWGAPDDINTTTTSSGDFEQWVYEDGNYLYFKNGVLVTIQN